MLQPYIIYFKYICPGDKKPGAVKQFRIYASTWEEARRLAAQQGGYPNIEVLRVTRA